jgi:AcrR family transcriptional regulator
MNMSASTDARATRSDARASRPAAAGGAAQAGPPRRQRNARGEGSRLTEDIVTAALALIERTGSDDAVTLRAVAREIGIAAPSIYPHFPDRDAIVTAVVVRVFDELAEAIRHGADAAAGDPVDRLIAGCEQYVRFGIDHPARYGVLFSERRNAMTLAADYCKPVVIGPGGRPVLEFGAEAFALLVDEIQACVEGGTSASTDVVADGTAVWVALHGTVTLRTALPGFPWPEPVSAFVRQLVLPLAKVSAAA